jgi:hypothetical protein
MQQAGRNNMDNAIRKHIEANLGGQIDEAIQGFPGVFDAAQYVTFRACLIRIAVQMAEWGIEEGRRIEQRAAEIRNRYDSLETK